MAQADGDSLFISRPDREPHSIIIYGRNGSVGAYYVKNCWRCNAQHFPAPNRDEPSDRQDLGPITRARAKALGFKEEILTSGAECRKEKNMFRACGICIGHYEMISAGL